MAGSGIPSETQGLFISVSRGLLGQKSRSKNFRVTVKYGKGKKLEHAKLKLDQLWQKLRNLLVKLYYVPKE